MRTPRLILLVGMGLVATKAMSQEAGYDPTDYLRQVQIEAQEKAEAEAVRPMNVTIGGVPYLRLDTAYGALYLQKTDDLRLEDLDHALCSRAFKASDLQTAVESAAELALIEKAKANAAAITTVARTRCGVGDRAADRKDQTTGGDDDARLNLGVDKRTLAPNIGVRADF